MRVRVVLSAIIMASLLTAGPAAAQVKKTEIVDAVKRAFAKWEAVECSGLKFEYAGELSAFEPTKAGAILIYFGYDNSTWIHGTSAYYVENDHDEQSTGALTWSKIAFNARDYNWGIGKAAKTIDIESAVLHLIAHTVGFYVGDDPMGYSNSAIQFNAVNSELGEFHKKGAQYTYFKDTGSCTRPEMPPLCGKPFVVDQPDAGMPDAGATDAGAPEGVCIMHSSPSDLSKGKPLAWATMPVKYYVYMHSEYGRLPGGKVSPNVPTDEKNSSSDMRTTDRLDSGTSSGDSGVSGDGGLSAPGDDGCGCAVNAPPQSGLVIGLLALLMLGLRRRR